MHIKLKNSNPVHELPNFYHDQTSHRIYLLKWSEHQDLTSESKNTHMLQCLDILEIIGGHISNSKNPIVIYENGDQGENERVWRFTFDSKPEGIALVKDLLYIVGGNKVVTLELSKIHSEVTSREEEYTRQVQDISYNRIE